MNDNLTLKYKYTKKPRTYEETHGESNKKMTIHVYHSAINFTI